MNDPDFRPHTQLPNVRYLSLTGNALSWLPELEVPAVETFEFGQSGNARKGLTKCDRITGVRITNILRNLKGLSVRNFHNPDSGAVLFGLL